MTSRSAKPGFQAVSAERLEPFHMRVVLYAEGPNETGLTERPPLSGRGSSIVDDDLGPAHLLTRRCIDHVTKHKLPSIQFHAPLRLGAASARGSHLLDPKRLEELLTWVHPARTPDLAVVIVDADGAESARRKTLNEVISQREVFLPPTVVAIAVEEFESWLVADQHPINRALGHEIDALDLKNWRPGKAKSWLMRRLAGVGAKEQEQIRRTLCQDCDLDVISNSSPSFTRFLDDLKMTCKSIA
jgi:hypothetical protein